MSVFNHCIHVETKHNNKYKLVVYEYKYGLRGDVFEYNLNKKQYEKIQSAKFYFKDKDVTIYHVKEYFNFI